MTRPNIIMILADDMGYSDIGSVESAERTLFWEHVGNAAVRRGRWKLVKEYDLPWELYDIDVDRAEQHDLAAENPDIVAELVSEWLEWARRSGVVPWEQMLEPGTYRLAYPPAVAPSPARAE